MALPNHEVNGYVKFMRDRTEDKRAEEQRAKNRERIVEQERQAAILEERNRLAREIHDTLAQGFTGIAIQLEAAEDSLTDSPESAKAHLLKARALARESLNEARRSVQALRPEGLYGGSLVSALQHMVEYAAIDNTTRVQFVTEGTPSTLPSDVEMNLLRISQEALTNTLKHAQASYIMVELIFEGKTVCLSVKDDGKGFAPHVPLSSEGYGITGMRERAERIGGKFKLTSKPGEGTTVEVNAIIDSSPPPVTHKE
jgi:signal transduction histidine kinase